MYRSVRARWCGRLAFYAGEPSARLAVSSRTARLLSDPIIPFYKIQKVNSLLGHTAYRRINNIQSAQECRPSEREQQQPSLLGIGLHSCARQNGNAHAQCDAPLERCRVIHDGNDIQFIKRQTVILEEIQCFLLGARVVLAQQERFVQERCQRVRLALIGTEMRCVR